MIEKERLAGGTKIRITFLLPSTMPAEQIHVVGEFNDWEPTLPMERAEPSSNWKLVLDLATGQCYRFRYLVDRQHWLNDIYADDHLENPYGSYDSVVDLRETALRRIP